MIRGVIDVSGLVGANRNQIKRELMTMWQIVEQVREETTVAV